MPVYLYYGEDTYSLNQKVDQLINQNIPSDWKTFNYVRFFEKEKNLAAKVFTEVMTLPFGEGCKIVHVDSDCFTDSLLNENNKDLEDKLSQIPTDSILLITGSKKPDCRKAAVKILLQEAQQEEFPLVPNWDKLGIINLIGKYAATHQVKLTPDITDYLVEAIGSNTARADSEFAKLAIYANGKTILLKEITQLVSNNNTDYSTLAIAMLRNRANIAITQVFKLTATNEHPLKIVATLTSIFRTWLITKAGVEAKLNDAKTAELADLKNPKRLYYLKDEVKYVALEKLKRSVLILAQLETELKSGTDNLTSRIVEICNT
ncbi:DNA polymerase III subunit delta [Scytonema hofmannii PCC 7110]|uniref:DNA polymerase III subunit delta n=1 Tax=Scytonema hofmannii PCC 7110 TaxID=128403 RepID=A0A139WQ04_9CYAN|nr:DNA polymerase III subunit delta [Scytonema hofmannii]KYC34506.1 DNA polymerase III subunit delta [Scytonema hofmannii PCC 7110]